MTQNLVGVNEMAEILSVPRSWIYGRTRLKDAEDQIPHIRFGKYLRFHPPTVIAHYEKQNENERR